MKLGSLYDLCHIYRPPPDVFHWQFSRTSFSYGLVGLSLFGGVTIMFSSRLTSFEGYAENDKVKLRMMSYCTNLAAVFTVVKVNVAAVVEKIVYRGFLLTSLTKWVATPTALLLSSVALGLSHVGAQGFNLNVFPQHFFFGLFSRAAYLYSRNLCAPIVFTFCNQYKSFGQRDNEAKALLENSVPGINVLINPDKPRKGCFEIRAEDGKAYFSLQDMKIPFKLMMDLDMDEVVANIAKNIGGE